MGSRRCASALDRESRRSLKEPTSPRNTIFLPRMKVSRRKAAGIGLIALGLAAAAVIISVNTLVDRNADRLIQEIQKSLGRKLTFDQLRPDFWGSLGLSVTHLRVAEDQRFAATPFIQTKKLKLQLALL